MASMNPRDVWQAIDEDLEVAMREDPASMSKLHVAVFYPGVHAVWAHRVAHALWTASPLLKPAALVVAAFSRFMTGVEIHPGATIGRRCFIDHGMGVVIGETSEIGDDVVIYQGVTLGGRARGRFKRHPTVGDRVMLGAGAKVIGAVTIGDDARISANALVVTDVPAGSGIVGNPVGLRDGDTIA